MAKKREPVMTPAEEKELMQYLQSLPKPKYVPCSKEIRDYFENTALPVIKDQALSELMRHNQYSPRLISFMLDGSMGIVDVGEAMGDHWGSGWSKDATARVHQFSALVPGVKLSIFCVETWMVTKNMPSQEDLDTKYQGSLANHPDKQEAMMFAAVHYAPETGEMMQLIAFVEVLKVLGATSSEMWRHTKYGKLEIVDPQDTIEGRPRMKGRFVAGDDGEDEN